MKKALAVILAGIMTASLMACGGGNATNSSSGAPEAKTEAAPAEDEAAPEETKTAEEAKGPEIVEITADNWEQYFDLVPYHQSGEHENEDGSTYPVCYNAFELILKDEYLQKYDANSGWYVDDELKKTIESDVAFLYDSDNREELIKQGQLIIPQAVNIEATFHFQYDGEILAVDDPKDYAVRFPYGYEATDGNQIEFDRLVSLQDINILYHIINMVRNENGEYDYEKNQDWPSPNLFRAKFFQEHYGTQIVEVSGTPTGSIGSDLEPEKSGEILDHFEVTLEEISGTVAIW